MEKWIFTRNSAWFFCSSTLFKIGIHLRTYTVIFKYKHTTARTNLLVWIKIYALHIACVETDVSLMNVFHLSLMIEKHDIQPYDIFPFCSLQSYSCRNWNDLTHIFFHNYSGYCRWRLHLCCNYNYCMFSKQIIRSICFQIGLNHFYTLIVDFKIYVHKNYMYTFQRKCRIIYLPQLQILVLVYYFLKWRQDLMR